MAAAICPLFGSARSWEPPPKARCRACRSNTGNSQVRRTASRRCARRLDAFVYDKPLLAWIIRQNFSSSIELLEATFEPQEYAFAVPINSPLRKSVGVAILAAIHSDWWEQTTSRYLGPR